MRLWPTPMDLGNVSGYDTKTTQGDSDTSNDMSCEGHKAGKGAGKKGPNGSGSWHRGKGAGRVAREMTEPRKEATRAPRAANPIVQ